MDVILTEVMRNRFAAMAAEASYIAYRTAHTTFVKQTQDYQVAMASVDGEFFAFPTQSGVTSGVCQNVRGLVDEVGIENLEDGDVIISNDPFSGGSLCTHVMDIQLIRPIYYKERLIAFAWAFIHASDIGGSVPGSEQCIGKLKRFKRVALRCEKTAQNYGSLVALGLTFILVKSVHTA